MGAALVLLLVGLGAMAAGVLIGRYYVPDDRQLRRTARHSKAYMRALSHLVARDHDTVITELRNVVEENVEDVEAYFALGAIFRSRGEHERAIRVHQALALRERDRRKLRQRAMYELGLDFRAAGMPRRATRAMEEVVVQEPNHEGALRALAALYEEQARFNEAAGLWQRLGRLTMSMRTLHRRVGEVAAWRRPRLVAKGDPDRDQVLAALRQAIAELPQGAVVLAEDETHVNLLPWVRATWVVRGTRQRVMTPAPTGGGPSSAPSTFTAAGFSIRSAARRSAPASPPSASSCWPPTRPRRWWRWSATT